MLLQLKDQAEIVIVINAADIEKSKVRGDLGITYDADVFRLIDAFRGIGLYVGSVVIAQYSGQAAAEAFKNRLQLLGVPVYLHYPIAGYPANIPLIVSDEGYGKNEYIETTRPLVIVTRPGRAAERWLPVYLSCIMSISGESRPAMRKFETFPIWNLPLKHPVNLAYEAATADLNDVNMIDPFHLEAYGTTAVNYNRDVEIFPVLNATFECIFGESPYKSPTDMGVNMAGKCIVDDEACKEASCQEIIRRYYYTQRDAKQGRLDEEAVMKVELLMSKAGVSVKDRACVSPALERAERDKLPAAAIQLPDGQVITGGTSSLLGASAAMLLNALKRLGGIGHDILLISPIVIEPIQNLKIKHLGNNNPRLHTDEILIALSISAATNPTAALALKQLSKLKGCEAHSSVILSQVDETTFRKLGVNLTTEPVYQSKKLYHK